MNYGKVKYLINGRVYTFVIIRLLEECKIGKCSKLKNKEIQLYDDHISDPEYGIILAKKIEEFSAQV